MALPLDYLIVIIQDITPSENDKMKARDEKTRCLLLLAIT